ncbi:hypothetical protein IFO70_33545 [Phormidium tenue FACHB-886]|nr:hypothetical protein [Phormidium tenue FACHB-886]
MHPVILLLVIFLAGAVGGIVNALISDNGFLKARKVTLSDGSTLYRPGYLGNMFIGAVAACISWGLYGPLAAEYIIGGSRTGSTQPQFGLTVSACVGAVLVGVAGARWLTNEVDKQLLRAAATAAAVTPADDKKAAQIASASPSEALRIARDIR